MNRQKIAVTAAGRLARRFCTTLAVALASASLALSFAGTGQAQTTADLTTYYQWDVMHRMTMKIGLDPDGSGALKRRAEKYTYDPDGQLIRTDVGTVNTVSISAGAVTVSGWTVLQTTQMDYDAAGEMTQVYADGGGAGATLVQTSYDDGGRQTCTATRMSASAFATLYATSHRPDACALTAPGTQGPDRITQTLYDSAGQTLERRQAVGTADQRTYATYTYTPNGKQATVKDARNNLTTVRYDGLDRLCRQEFPIAAVSSATSNGPPAPQGQTYLACRATLADAKAALSGDFEEYGYDANGNKTWIRKRDDTGLSFTFDALDRQTAKSGDNIVSVATTYDLLGKPLSVLFSSGASSGQGTVYVYDLAGRKLSETSFGRAVSYCYGGATCPNVDKINPTRVSWPDGNYVTYAYDYAARLQSANAAGAWVSYGYDDLGRQAALTRANGVSDALGYDPAGRLNSWALSFATAGSAKNQADTLTYNPASQVLSEALTNDAYLWVAPTSSLAATADGLNRDATIVVIGGGGCAANGKGYDCNGDLTNDGRRVFTYDGENRLVSMTGPATATAALAYDPLGRLRQTTIGGVVTQFVYDGDQLVAEYDGSGNILRRYVHGEAEDDPLIWFEGAGFGDARYLHADRQGSVIAWSNASGVSQATYSYGPYGEPGDSWAAGSRFRYTGQIALPELKLYHYKARAYDPARGWFLQTDPIGYDDDLNLYAYTGGDPVNGDDPTGTDGDDEDKTRWAQVTALYRGTGSLQCSGSCIEAPPPGILLSNGQMGYGVAPPPTPPEPDYFGKGLVDWGKGAAEELGGAFLDGGLGPEGSMANAMFATSVRAEAAAAPAVAKLARGGENAAAAVGRAAHARLAAAVKAKPGWVSSPRFVDANGVLHIPDVMTPRGFLLEFKPRTVSGIKAGARQAQRYIDATGKKVRVIYYDPPKSH